MSVSALLGETATRTHFCIMSPVSPRQCRLEVCQSASMHVLLQACKAHSRGRKLMSPSRGCPGNRRWLVLLSKVSRNQKLWDGSPTPYHVRYTWPWKFFSVVLFCDLWTVISASRRHYRDKEILAYLLSKCPGIRYRNIVRD